jgi:hypothetical protein
MADDPAGPFAVVDSVSVYRFVPSEWPAASYERIRRAKITPCPISVRP